MAIATLRAGVADELLLNDVREEIAEGDAMDLADPAMFYPEARVRTALSFSCRGRSLPAPYSGSMAAMMRRFPHLILACITLVLASCVSTQSVVEPIPEPAYHIAAYVRGTTRMDLSEIDARRLTHVYYAFADVENDELIMRRDDDAENLRKLTALRAANPNLKVLVSAGGWSWSGGFSDAALTDSSRARFARSAVRLIEEHDLDGVDLDWEYPGLPGAGNTHRPEDRENFTLLLRAVREHIDALAARNGRAEGYLLTIAAGAGQSYLEHTDMGEVAQVLDLVNLMTYDFAGSWSDRTGHHTNLHPSDCGNVSASEAVERFVAEGVPPEKLVLGAAFYGRSWSDVDLAGGDGLCAPYNGDTGSYSFVTLARDVVGKGGYERRWDNDALAPYLVHPDSAEFITYDDEASIQFKALYVRERGLGGVMFWAYDHDPSTTLLRVLHSYLSVPR